MRVDVRKVLMAGAMGLLLAGCKSAPSVGEQGGADGGVVKADPDARSFTGTVIGKMLATSTLIFAKDERHGNDAFVNQVWVKYDANTKFFIDDKPATLDQLQLYMVGKIDGHMREGRMFAEAMRFSSELPKNVHAGE